MGKYKNIEGIRFSKLIAVERVGTDIHRHSIWKCICDCGNETYVTLNQLISGKTKSCGCLHTKHGLTSKGMPRREFNIWRNMIDRTSNPNSKDFNRYGKRGISVCDEWRNSFKKFYDWANANGYSDNLTIDRINNDGNYEPSNCRWATVKTQSNNKRNNVLLNFNNETHTLTQWSEILKIKPETITSRLNRGWNIKESLTAPLKNKFKEEI